jgi:hypothetical protein
MVPLVKGMPPVRWQLGQEWFKEQDEGTQRQILGRGAFEAWQKGKIRLGEMVTVHKDPVWGDSVQPTAVGELVSSG